MVRFSAVFLLVLGLATGCASQPASAPDNDALLATARVALEQGDASTAMANIQIARQTAPNDINLLQLLLRVYTLVDNLAGQQETALAILAQQPDNLLALEQMGIVSLHSGQLAAAGDYFRHAVAVEPRSWRAWNGLGIIADVEHRYEAAQSHYRHGLEIVPGHPRLLANMGWSKLLAGEFAKAEQYMRAALDKAPGAVTTQSNLAFCLALQGRYEEARAIYSKLYDAPVAANNLGYAAMLRGDSKDAKAFLEQALKADPRFYDRASRNLDALQSVN